LFSKKIKHEDCAQKLTENCSKAVGEKYSVDDLASFILLTKGIQ